MNKKFLEHYKTVDPDYGSQQHQAKFTQRMLRLQELEPCTRDHSSDVVEITLEDGSKKKIPWPTHTSKCYSQRVVDQVRKESLS